MTTIGVRWSPFPAGLGASARATASALTPAERPRMSTLPRSFASTTTASIPASDGSRTNARRSSCHVTSRNTHHRHPHTAPPVRCRMARHSSSHRSGPMTMYWSNGGTVPAEQRAFLPVSRAHRAMSPRQRPTAHALSSSSPTLSHPTHRRWSWPAPLRRGRTPPGCPATGRRCPRRSPETHAPSPRSR